MVARGVLTGSWVSFSIPVVVWQYLWAVFPLMRGYCFQYPRFCNGIHSIFTPITQVLFSIPMGGRLHLWSDFLSTLLLLGIVFNTRGCEQALIYNISPPLRVDGYRFQYPRLCSDACERCFPLCVGIVFNTRSNEGYVLLKIHKPILFNSWVSFPIPVGGGLPLWSDSPSLLARYCFQYLWLYGDACEWCSP